MEDVKFRDRAAAVTRLALHQNPPDERGDGLDGIRHGVKTRRLQARIFETRMSTLADGPDLGLARQVRERVQSVIGDDIVKSPHQALVRAEHDGANHSAASSASFHHARLGRAPPETNAQPHLHGAMVVA